MTEEAGGFPSASSPLEGFTHLFAALINIPLDRNAKGDYHYINNIKKTVEAEIKTVRALTGSRGNEKPAERRLLNGPLRAQ